MLEEVVMNSICSETEFVARVFRARNLLELVGLDARTAVVTMIEGGESPEEAFLAVKAARVVPTPRNLALEDTWDE